MEILQLNEELKLSINEWEVEDFQEDLHQREEKVVFLKDVQIG